MATLDVFGINGTKSHLNIDNVIISEVSSLPQHCNRLVGAYFSTLEVLIMIRIEKANHDIKNLLLKNAIATVQYSLFPNRLRDSFEHIECLFREYRNISPYCYVFNRRNGVFPESYSEEICEYVDSILVNDDSNAVPLQLSNTSGISSHDNDDENSIIDTMIVPQLTAPSIAPLKPYNFDEMNAGVKTQAQLKIKNINIDSEFQFANDMARNVYLTNDILEDSIDIHSIDIPSAKASPENSLQSQQIFSAKQKIPVHQTEENNDVLSVSMNESSILDAYLNNDYKAWEMDAIHSMNTNIPMEEDEDSDGDQMYQASRGNSTSVSMYGALSSAKKASQTRLRSPSAGDPVRGNRRSTNASKGVGTKKGKGKGSSISASATIPRVALMDGSSDEAELLTPSSSSLKKATSVADTNSSHSSKVKKEKELRFSSRDEYESDNRLYADVRGEKSDDNSIEEIVDGGVEPKNYDLGFHRQVNRTTDSRWNNADRNSNNNNNNSNGRGKAAYLLSESESSVDLSDVEKHPEKNDIADYTDRVQHGFSSSQSDGNEERNTHSFKNNAVAVNSVLKSQLKVRNPLDLSLEALPQNDAVMEFSVIDEDDGSHNNNPLKPVAPKTSWGGRGNALDDSDNEDQVESKPQPVVWKSVKSVTVKRSVLATEDNFEITEQPVKLDVQELLSSDRTAEVQDARVNVGAIEPGLVAVKDVISNPEKKVPMEQDSHLLFDINDVGTADLENIQISPLPAQRHPQALKATTPATPIAKSGTPQSPNTLGSETTPIRVEKQRNLSDSDRQLAIEKLKTSISQKKKQSLTLPNPATAPSNEDMASTKKGSNNFIAMQDSPQRSTDNVSDSMSSLILLPAAPPPLPAHDSQSPPPPAVVASVQFEDAILAAAQQKQQQNQNQISVSQDTIGKDHLTGAVTGGGGGGPPPRPKSVSAQQRTSIALTSSLQSNAGFGGMFHILPDHYEPPPLSEFAEQCGVIVEGFLNKKSAVTGLWQQRYFVLSESATQFCVLRIFGKAVPSKWGPLPLELKRAIPIHLIERVDTSTAKGSKGREFLIKWQTSTPMNNGSRPPSLTKKSFSFTGFQRNSASFSSVGAEDSSGKTTLLQAQDAETRLLWVTMINRAISAFLLQMD